MIVGLIMMMLAVYAADHNSPGIMAIALIAMLVALVSSRLPRP